MSEKRDPRQGDGAASTWRSPGLGQARVRRLIVVVIVALSGLVVLVAVLGTEQILSARSSLRNQIRNGELTSARLAASAVSSAVSSRVEILQNLAVQPGSANLVEPGQAVNLAAALVAIERLYPQFSNIAVLSPSGALLSEAPSWPATAEVVSTRRASKTGVLRSGQRYVTGAFVQPDGELAVTVATVLRGADGSIVGVLQGAVPVSSISEAVGGTRLNGGAILYLVDQHGHILTGHGVGANSSHSSTGPIRRALSGQSGTTTATLPGLQGGRLVAYVPVSSLGWAVIVENSQSAIEGPVASMTERLAAIGGAVLLFAIAAAVGLWFLLRQLGRQRDEVTAIFASVGEGVATVDASGQVLKINPALEQICGCFGGSALGRPWWETFVMYDERGSVIGWEETVVARAIRTRDVVASRGFTLSLLTKDGRRTPVAVTASPLVIDRLVPSGAVVVVRDVSGEREVDQLKTSLVSTVSHELRTPLTLIQGFSELLLVRKDLDSARSHEALAQVHASSQRLGRLIDDLLSVSRIESGRLTIEAAPIDLKEAVTEVVSSFALEDDHRFVTDIPSDLGAVVADRDKTVQVLTNLLSNAVKYSPSGSEVRVAARCAGNHAEVGITDHGIGVPTSEAAGVFEKFSRSDRSEVRQVGGTGLGLYITKNLVELQGGQLWMRSEEGRGSTFTFTLPLEMAMAGTEAK
jgi:PAS domain S-box-containing protein